MAPIVWQQHFLVIHLQVENQQVNQCQQTLCTLVSDFIVSTVFLRYASISRCKIDHLCQFPKIFKCNQKPGCEPKTWQADPLRNASPLHDRLLQPVCRFFWYGYRCNYYLPLHSHSYLTNLFHLNASLQHLLVSCNCPKSATSGSRIP